MKVTLLDLGRNPGKIVEAIEHNETLTLTKRGKEIAYIVPKNNAEAQCSLLNNPALGMWKDRTDLQDPVTYVQNQRKGRFSDH